MIEGRALISNIEETRKILEEFGAVFNGVRVACQRHFVKIAPPSY